MMDRIFVAFVALAFCLACSREKPPGASLPSEISASAASPAGSSSAVAPVPAVTAAAPSELPAPPKDETFEAFGDDQLKHCKLEGDWGGSNADMAQRAYSMGRCFVGRGGGILTRMPNPQRQEVLGGAASAARGDGWYRDWAVLAALTTELNVRMAFTSGSAHTGGTMLLTMRPASHSGVAQEVLYWLHSVTDGDVNAFAKRVTDEAPRGKMIAPTLAELEAQAIRYLKQVSDTPIPEYYPVHMNPLYGGDWRRVIYDIRQLKQMVPLLTRRICRSSVTLAAKLGGAKGCADTVDYYLYAQIGEIWTNDPEGNREDSEQREVPPGIDDAYYPFATATYESCEVDERGERVTYQDSLRCLKEVLLRKDATTPDAAVGLARGYLAAQCTLEVAPGAGLDSPMARPLISADECLAVGSIRARYFLSSWTSGEISNVRKHLQAHAAWGARVNERLPRLKARFEGSLRSPPPDDGTWATASTANYKKGLQAISWTVDRARQLATQLCASASPVASELGSRCTQDLTDYWLSYSYVPGMRWDGETDATKPPAAKNGED